MKQKLYQKQALQTTLHEWAAVLELRPADIKDDLEWDLQPKAMQQLVTDSIMTRFHAVSQPRKIHITTSVSLSVTERESMAVV